MTLTNPNIAIVCTLRDMGASLQSWLRYHIEIGFETIFLFFDDPEDPSIPVADSFPQVVLRRHDGDLVSDWSRRFHGSPLFESRGSEVMARQIMNAELALEESRKAGVDWLLHIDADELFYLDSLDAQSHFREMDQNGYRMVSYLNSEAAPEDINIQDCFKDVSLFKKNPGLLNLGAARKRRLFRDVPQLAKQHFLYYQNGKSAARVTPATRAKGVHQFAFPGEALNLPLLSVPTVLHYACCGFNAFWQKYRTLGAIADTWFGDQDIRSLIGPFHLEARDVVALDDQEAALEFYRKLVVFDDSVIKERLIQSGVLQRIEKPGQLLKCEG